MERNKNVVKNGSFPGSGGGPNLLENHQDTIQKGKRKEKVVADKSDSELRIDPFRALTNDPDTNVQPPQKKCKSRTKHQKEVLEAVFKDFPRPSQKQILDLSIELGLDPSQVKFWFQNKRTHIKKLTEQQECVRLRTENFNLKAENQLYKDVLTGGLCATCRNTTVTDMRTKLLQQNSFLNEEVNRLSAIVAQFVGGAMVCYGAPSQSAPPPS